MTFMDSSDPLILSRNRIVSYIFTHPKVSTIFPRDLQYLAISIIDKFVSALTKTTELPDPEIEEHYFSISALIIAFKFVKNSSPGLKQILALLKKGEMIAQKYQTEKMVRSEQEILQKINFEIPQTTCYAFLQNFINSQSFWPERNDFQIKTTMRLLKEISLVSSETSNCPVIGKELYELVLKKRSSERSKRLYKLVISSLKAKSQENKTVKAQNE